MSYETDPGQTAYTVTTLITANLLHGLMNTERSYKDLPIANDILELRMKISQALDEFQDRNAFTEELIKREFENKINRMVSAGENETQLNKI